MLLDITRETDLQAAVDALRAGRLVAFPTETVYGLGADGFNEEACKNIYAAKGRPSDNPLILHIADMSALRDIAEEIPEAAVDLAEAFWPGPLNLVLKKRKVVSPTVSGGLDTVAVRMPDNDLTRTLIRAVGHPLAGPSANVSGRPSPTLATHVEHDFGDKIAGVVDGGACRVGGESTLLDPTTTRWFHTIRHSPSRRYSARTHRSRDWLGHHGGSNGRRCRTKGTGDEISSLRPTGTGVFIGR